MRKHANARIVLVLIMAVVLMVGASSCALIEQIEDRIGGGDATTSGSGVEISQVIIMPDETTKWEPEPGTTVYVGVTGEARRNVWMPVVEAATEDGINIVFQIYENALAANNALLSKDIHLNFVQTYADFTYTELIMGEELGIVGYAMTASMAVYGSPWASGPHSIPGGASIRLPNEPVALNRAMRCIEEWGAVSIDPGASYQATPDDIVRNMHDVTVNTAPYDEIPSYVGRSNYVVMDTWQAIDSGYDPANAMYTHQPVDGSRSQYTEIIVSVFEDRNDPLYEYIAELFYTDEARAYLLENYGEAVFGAWPLPSPTPTPIGYTTTTTINQDIIDRYVTPVPGQTNTPIWGN